MLAVAVVGSGPAGVYAAEALVEHGDVHVDVFDVLPCPFGLVRYGVAPDHPKLKSISEALRRVLEAPEVRFIGNVRVGSDISLEALHAGYDAVIVACGAAIDRRMGIAGEQLPGSYSATEFVSWYSGHPDAQIKDFPLTARSVAVVGVGNVAIDVTRILAKSADDLRSTDVPGSVLAALGRSAVEQIHLIGRRGPVQAKFTTKELRELGEVTNADVLIDPADLDLDEVSEEMLRTNPGLRRNLEVMQEWAQRRPTGRPRTVRLRFWSRPVQVLGEGSVSGLRIERTRLNADGDAVGTAETTDLDVEMVLRSVGYQGVPVAGLPFDEARGIIPNDGGRVVRDGAASPGEYVAGWIKRGPTGLIGTNRKDAKETVAAMFEDMASRAASPTRDPDAVLALLRERGLTPVTWQGWCEIDRAEIDLGRIECRERAKIADRSALLAAAATVGF